MTIRVTHVVVAGQIGGAERMLVDLAGLAGARHGGAHHRVAVMTPDPALTALFRSAGLDVLDFGPVREDPLAFLIRSLGRRAVAWLEAVLRRTGAQIVQLHTFGSQVLGTRAALRLGLPVVRTEHSTRAFDDRACWPFARWSLARCARSVCVSAAVATVAAARAPWARSRLTVIHNGVDLSRFQPSSAAAPIDAPLALALVGRLEPRKGVDLALRALRQVPGARLDVVGDGPCRAQLERLARQLDLGDRVAFHGHVDDVRPALARAHAVVCSSRSEGLGLALLEAMAMARPVVGFAVGGVREIVVHERTGLVTRDRTPAALSAIFARALRERPALAELGSAARCWVEGHASARAMCAAYGALYAELARAPGEPHAAASR